ncbi:RsmD family RNA methyltransferase [Candidatus Saccharibacteria bacterium]|nr:RsmD family RNA methyltransferase [Candidatus Saccharibacteria bacterium]
MDKLKITSGKYRGISITTPGNGTHPMGARERIALFNMVNDYLKDASILDAFSGSGALGIEALSRGAVKVTFIEKNAKACQIIKINLAKIGLKEDDNINVIKSDVYETDRGLFDLVIADPPYDEYDATKIQILAKMVAKDGILILSHPGDVPQIAGMELTKTHQYAGAHLSIFSKG